MHPRAVLIAFAVAVTLAAAAARPAVAGPTLELAVGRGYLYTHCRAGTSDGSSSLDVESVGSEGCVARFVPGYEWSWGRTRLGVELGIVYSNMRAGIGGDVLAVGASAQARTGRVVTASGRVGVEIAPGAQVYGRLGYSTMEYRSEISTDYGEISERNRGEVQALIAGGGVQVEFAPGWAVRWEYTHMDYERATGVEDIEGIEQLRWLLEPRIEVITVGIVRIF